MRLSFFLMGNIACAVLYRYYKHRSLLNGFVHTCLKLWDIGGGGVGFFLVCFGFGFKFPG